MSHPYWQASGSMQNCQYQVSPYLNDDDSHCLQLLAPDTGQIFLDPDDVEILEDLLTTQFDNSLLHMMPAAGGMLSVYLAPIDDGNTRIRYGPRADPTYKFDAATLSWLSLSEAAFVVENLFYDLDLVLSDDRDFLEKLWVKNGRVNLVNSSILDCIAPREIFSWLRTIGDYVDRLNRGVDENAAQIQWFLAYEHFANRDFISSLSPWSPRWSN